MRAERATAVGREGQEREEREAEECEGTKWCGARGLRPHFTHVPLFRVVFMRHDFWKDYFLYGVFG